MMSQPRPAMALSPEEEAAPGWVEIRPCPACHIRLAVGGSDLGQMTACPGCGWPARALAAAGPFAVEPVVELMPATAPSP